jgi:hypothetical protein
MAHVFNHLRGEPMDRRIGEFRLALQRPRWTSLDERQRRERRELRRHHHGPVAIYKDGVAGDRQDRRAGGIIRKHPM